ncbi:HU family DNA-binding protein [Halobacillus yeomjeoni]|uniref:HU family DNA-binding protein n=1 Tax=Halobacillus yeomjeoni TaxID=311194 RepID=UPI001CD5CD4A|nr:HU family DNA-binding protein [Halobacillus yeomjeoni]MCA0982565.1 HU family DNA-binding protein [Halobacillus yeomjeoni]
MNKTDIVNQVTSKRPLQKLSTKKALDSIPDTLTSELSNGNKVQFPNIGTFEVKKELKERGETLNQGRYKLFLNSAPVKC